MSNETAHAPITVAPTNKHNRTILFSGLPVAHKSDLASLEVSLNYTEEPHEGNRLHKAIALDNKVIPFIHRACNSHDKLTQDKAALVAALESAVKYLEANRPTGKIQDIYHLLNQYENDVMKPARAALASAK